MLLLAQEEVSHDTILAMAKGISDLIDDRLGSWMHFFLGVGRLSF